jgi:hypothetical protein
VKRLCVGILASAAGALLACGGGTGGQTPRPSSTVGQATVTTTSTVTPASTAAANAATNCTGSAPIQPQTPSDVIVNADGDGVADRFAVLSQAGAPDATAQASLPSPVPGTTRSASGTLELQLVLDGRIAMNVEAAPTTNSRVAPIGGYDVDGDGRDELFAVTGNGAYTTWIDVFEFDPATCTLARVTNPDPHAVPPLFAVGASVRNGVGLDCVDHLLVATMFTSSDEPLHYTGTRTSYRIVDNHVEQVAQTNVDGAQAATFRCGYLTLPGAAR